MKASDLLNSYYVRWMDADKGPDSDIVISSRIRLARNLHKIPFPHLLNNDNGGKCMNEISKAWKNAKTSIVKGLDLITFDQISHMDRQILVEKHLISPDHAKESLPYRGLLVNQDGSLAIMINEEDHLRIQCFLPGLQLEECNEKAQIVDDDLEKSLDFAFDERRGYLTSCPTNVGTGMRASVMLHLPAIAIAGQTGQIFQNIGHLGMTVRGLYGEGTQFIGNLFQLSNQITLGQTEADIISNLNTITTQIIEQERNLRKKLANEMKYNLEDRIHRAYGILSNAVVISSQEAIALLSDVRLGVDMGILKGLKPFALNELMVAISPAHLQKKAGKEMDAFLRDVKRAEVVKEKLII
ncbi:MAG: protein arginine kinase [Syntrophomonadaceae bacterium]|jgi:protein arginine kinase